MDHARKCHELRKTILETCLKAQTGHVTSSLSCVEILVSLYYTGILKHDPNDPLNDQRDRFILSKAQASPLFYAVLADKGFFPKQDLNNFAQKDGSFGVHLQHSVPGAEITAGALGHGLGVATGIALRGKMDRKLYTTYVLLGDGELYEGSTWESLKFAGHHQLNNLVIIIDRNYLCTTDFTENIIALEPLDKKFESFGFNVIRLDGHNVCELTNCFQKLKSRPSRQATVVIADTVKGKGIDSMCYQPLCHGVPPQSDKQIEAARTDLIRGEK